MGCLRAILPLAGLSAALALFAAGCGGSVNNPLAKPPTAKQAPRPHCAYPAGWQSLANRIAAPVYCPGWLPDPLTSQIGGKWNNINSVSPDRSYLESFVWQETGGGAAGGELHVNLRGYPGRTKIPTCRTGGTDSKNVPCFDNAAGAFSANGIHATFYTVNQDADEWHIALLWHKYGNLYTLSEHVAPPLTAEHVMRYLKQELRALILYRPQS
jgi:hypothetical protein